MSYVAISGEFASTNLKTNVLVGVALILILSPVYFAYGYSNRNPSSASTDVSSSKQMLSFSSNSTSQSTIYYITFGETGPPSGYVFSVNLGGTNKTSTTSSIVFNETNGVYYWNLRIFNSTYSGSPEEGTITVNGSNVTQQILFNSSNLTMYNLASTETGLPSDASWSVTLNGITESSSTDRISFEVPNGTYYYSINDLSGYASFHREGNVRVNGVGGTETAVFSAAGISPVTILAVISILAAVSIMFAVVLRFKRAK